MMKHRTILFTLLTLIAVLVLVSPVFAYIYQATYTVTSNSTVAYDMLGVRTDNDTNNQWMADNGYMNSTANDTRIETLGGLEQPHMVTDNATFTAIPVPAGSQTNLYFTTGNSELDSFYVITGYNGYVSVADASNLEPSANFTIGQSGFWDTGYDANKSAIYKQDAIGIYISGTGNITSTIGVLLEDFETDDWVDVGTKIVVNTTAERLEYDSNRQAVDSRSSYDGGVVVGNEWVLDFTGEVINSTGTVANNANFYFALVDTLENFNGAAGDWLGVDFQDSSNDATSFEVAVFRYDGGVIATSAYITGLSANNTYYYSLERVDATNASINVFTDATRTSHFAGSPQTLVIPATVNGLRYIQGSNSDDGAGIVFTVIGWMDDLVFAPATSVTATGVSSGEYAVTVNATDLIWAEGDVPHFIADANSYVDCQISYNATAKFWMSGWFRRDAAFAAGSTTSYLWGKRINGNNQCILYLNGVDGKLTFNKTTGALADFTITSAETSWAADTWYHFIVSISDVNGVRMRVENGVAVTDPDVSAMTNGGNFVLGSRHTAVGESPATIRWIGEIANVVVGTDDLTPLEETLLYRNTFPGDETDFWYLDEGTGTTIYSYGSVPNNGTAGSANTWETSIRPSTLTLSIDGIVEDSYARPASVPDNANDWELYRGNALPYSDNTSITVNGTLQLWFRPTSMIIGTNLPDRETTVATNNGTFVWGDNPTGVSVTLGGLVSSGQPSPGLAIDDPTPDIMPGVEVTDWYIEPDVSGTLLTNPMRPFVTILSDTTTLTELQAWRLLGTALLLLVTVATAKVVRGHHAITGIAAGACTLGLVVLTIYPMWGLVFMAFAVVAGLISERTPSV